MFQPPNTFGFSSALAVITTVVPVLMFDSFLVICKSGLRCLLLKSHLHTYMCHQLPPWSVHNKLMFFFSLSNLLSSRHLLLHTSLPFLALLLSVRLPSTELLRHLSPKASQTSRQATDALHAVQPEGKQEGKTPIHGVCFYCLSSLPLKSCRGFRVGNSQAMTPSPSQPPCGGDSPLCYPAG